MASRMVMALATNTVTHFLILTIILILLVDVAGAHPVTEKVDGAFSWAHPVSEQVDGASSWAHNRIHEIMKAPMRYILLLPIVLVFLGSIPLNIIAWRHYHNPTVQATILAAKSARAAQCAQILVEEAEGKATRKAERAKALAREAKLSRA